MPSRSINHLAVLVAAIVFFVWGYVWYGVLFKAATAAMMVGVAPAGPTAYIIGFLMALVLAYGTAIALSKGEAPSAGHGISFGLFMGVIFYASVTLTQTMFASRPIAGWLIDIGWSLIGFAVVGAIVGGWRRKA